MPQMDPMDGDKERQLTARVTELCSRPLEPRPTRMAPQTRPLKEVRAVLFDVYGTLFVSASGDIGASAATAREDAITKAFTNCGVTGDHAAVARRAAERLVESVRADHERSRQRGIAHPEVDIVEVWKTVHEALAAEGLPHVASEGLSDFALEYECHSNPVWPMPDLVSTLEALRDGGWRLGIVSNAQFYTPLLFPALLGRSLESLGFDSSLCVWSYQLREAKPSPKLFRHALDESALAPEECLFVGNDMLNDVRAAQEAGLRTALFAGDERSLRLREGDARIGDCRPDIVVTTLSAVVEAIA